MSDMAHPPTALGVPLEPGERVLFFEKTSYKGDKIAFAILGVLFLIVVVGVVLLVLAYYWERWQPRGVVVTNRRVIAVDKNGVPTSTPLADIADLDAERQQSHAGGGGLVGALVSVAVDAVADHMVSKNPKHDPAYWKRTVALVLVRRDGARVRVPTRRAPEAGPFVMRLCGDPASVERLPAVAVEP